MWKVGQKVWCVVEGPGTVLGINGPVVYPVHVRFESGREGLYTTDGKMLGSQPNRALFFSKPKVEGATEPPFVPTLQKGDIIAATSKDDGETCRWKVYSESEHTIRANGVLTDVSITLRKKDFIVYKLGEPLY